ncbi:LAQU0S04e08394g1_1 [Lachancea quebecensis]|uniref:LAQU0S04e08394g1_1 n=1 Tax=Lachancea quebecensis TaxID=1654605 RepID=A0A0P1KR49_9SACH|nr:LAQU0S04e08394g1_1 [Lachancea quebecensis]
MDDELCSADLSEPVVTALEDPSRIHYKDLWLKSPPGAEQRILELFSFGKVKDAGAELQMLLTATMWQKLRRLTMLALSCQVRVLSYEQIRDECALGACDEAEQLAMSLGNLVELSIDQVKRQVVVRKCCDCRDVYNGERPLTVVGSPTASGQEILQDLRRWRRKLNNDML